MYDVCRLRRLLTGGNHARLRHGPYKSDEALTTSHPHSPHFFGFLARVQGFRRLLPAPKSRGEPIAYSFLAGSVALGLNPGHQTDVAEQCLAVKAGLLQVI